MLYAITLREFLSIILPLFFIALFVKSFISSCFLIYPGDIILAFVIALLTFRNSGILLYIFLFFLGLLEGLDFSNIEVLSAIYFAALVIIWRGMRKYFTFEKTEYKIIIWGLNIFLFLTFRYVVYLYTLEVPLNWILLLNLSVKSFYYICTTFFWVVIFYKILNLYLSNRYEKI